MIKNAFIRWIKRHSLTTPIFPIVFLAAIGIYGYLNNFEFPVITQVANYLKIAWKQDQSGQDATGTGFVCDGRTTCPQMTSCDEAKFFQKNCSVENMDGDLDGIPCESEWCTR